MRSKTTYLSVLSLVAVLLAAPLSAQKAGQITKSTGAAFVVQPPARATLKPTQIGAAPGTAIRWHDTLLTEDGGRIRAQLNDGSILSIGQKTKLVVNKHDEKTQQSSFELNYGVVRATVQHLSRSDSAFEVRTNTAVCGVLGTDEALDANSPTATVVIAISGVVTVKSSNPNVAGSVQLSPGQTTTVNQGQPPSNPTQATAGQLNGVINNTGGSTTPDPTVSNPTPSLQIGKPLTIDGRASTGGLGTVASYNWQIVNGLNQSVYTSANPVLNIDTTSWAPGAYTGTLTVTNTATPPQSASVTFTFTLAAPDPAPLIPALASAYQTGQVRTFMNLFDPVHYAGYAALEQSITQSFNNITVTGVNILTAAGASTGAATAHYNVVVQIGYTLKNTALPVITPVGASSAPAQLRVPSDRSGAGVAGTGSISGSAGAVATFVVLSGPQTGFVQSAINSVNYSFTGLQDGVYTLTPQRTGFTFSPASITVTIKSGAAITGADFTAQPQPLSIQANAILDLGYVPGPGWLFTNISGSLGSAGIVGVPGTTNPQTGNIPVGSGASNTPGNVLSTQVVPSFTIAPPTAAVPVLVGSQTAAIPVTITPVNGFTGSVAMNFTFATGISLVSGPTVVNVPSSSPVIVNYVFAAAGSANPGTAGVVYAATSGTIGPVIGGISLAVTQVGATVTGPGSSQTNPVQLFAGNGSGGASIAISPVLPGESLSVTPISGFNTAFSPLNNGTATLTVTPTGPNTGIVQFLVNVLVNGVVTNSVPVFVNLTPPVKTPTAPATVTVAPGQPASAPITVQYNTGFSGTVIVTPPPNGGGLSFSPSSVILTTSGAATFTVTASQAFVQALRQGAAAPGSFTVTAGGYSTTVAVSFTTLAAADFSLSVANSLSLAQNSSGTITITVTQNGGTGNIPITLSASGFPTGISAAPAGSATTNGNGSVTFNVSALFTAATGTPTFTVTGTSGALSHSIPVPVTITAGGSFNLSAALTGTIFDGGGACTGCVTVTVTPVVSFTVPIAITSSSTIATASGPATIAPGSSGQYTVTATGAGTLTFTGTAGTITQTAAVTITPVVGFSLGVSGTSTFPGGSSTVTVTVNRSTGFNGAVVITPTSSAGVSLSPASVTVTAGSPSANFTANIAATDTGSSVTANFSGTAQGGVIAVAGSGSISIGNVPFGLSAGSVTGFAGQTVPVVVTVTRNAGFSGAVVVAPTSGISGVIVTPSSITVSGGSTTANFVATIPAAVTSGGTIQFTGTLSGGTLTANASATLTVTPPFTLGAGSTLNSMIQGGSTSGQVSITLAAGFNGPVTLSAVTATGAASASLASSSVTASGKVTLNLTAGASAAVGSSTITVTAQAGTYSQTATYTTSIVVAFTAQASSPTSLTVFNGFSNTVSVGVTLASAFQGPVTASISAPAGLNVVAQGSSTLSSSGSVSFTLSAPVSGGSSGTATVTLSGGGINIQIPFDVTVQIPYSVSGPATTTQVYSSLPTTVGVTVTLSPGFNSAVTITAPTTLPRAFSGDASVPDHVRRDGQLHRYRLAPECHCLDRLA